MRGEEPDIVDRVLEAIAPPKEIAFDYEKKVIFVAQDMDASDLYRKLKLHWKDDDRAICYPFPMRAIVNETDLSKGVKVAAVFEMIEGWGLASRANHNIQITGNLLQ